ncbi:MAG: hypothetical protein HQ538_03765 [Parcubacteria group bacterium]|nr:hypothetical protein [Parcubacteria group bacterium]
MPTRKYKFTSYDLKYKRELEKKRGSKIPDEEFYKYIQKLREQLKEYVKAVKKWVEEKPWEAEQLSKLVKDWEEKEKNKELYEKLAKIKKLTVAELQNLLTPILKKEGYIKLEFSKPEIGKDVVIGFTVQDNKVSRGEYESKIQLQRAIKKALENTNWRLMSEGAHYRLGLLLGRLRGYESDEDLLRLIKKQN